MQYDDLEFDDDDDFVVEHDEINGDLVPIDSTQIFLSESRTQYKT